LAVVAEKVFDSLGLVLFLAVVLPFLGLAHN